MVAKKPLAKTVAVERFEIELDTANPKGVYPPGATLRGNVVLVNKREITFHDILVRIKGSACVGWFDFSRFKQRKVFETYIDETISVFQNKGDCIKQVPGEHRYPFNFVLPANIPSSYKEYVRYNIKATIADPSGENKVFCVTKIPFIVESVVDLNEDENARFPVRVKQRAGTDNSAQFIEAEAWLDKAGYTPGETIRFNAKIENNRNETVGKSYVQLIQYTTLTDNKNHQHIREKVIFQGEMRVILKNSALEWNRYPIVLPQLPPSRFENCKFIDISYVVVLLLDIGITYSNVVIPLNIVIGNVRLQKEPPNVTDRLLTPLQSIYGKIKRLTISENGVRSTRNRKKTKIPTKLKGGSTK